MLALAFLLAVTVATVTAVAATAAAAVAVPVLKKMLASWTVSSPQVVGFRRPMCRGSAKEIGGGGEVVAIG